MEPDRDYQQALTAAELEVDITAKAWASQYRKRKADRNPQVDEEVRGRWLAAKENLRELRNSGAPGGSVPFTTKEVKQQEVESVLTFTNNANSPIRIEDEDHDSVEASAEPNLGNLQLGNISAQLSGTVPPSHSLNTLPAVTAIEHEHVPPAVTANERAPPVITANEHSPLFHSSLNQPPAVTANARGLPGATANGTVPPSHSLNQPPAPNEPGVAGGWMDGYFFPANLYPTTTDAGRTGESNTGDQGYFASFSLILLPSPDGLGNILPNSTLFLPVGSHAPAEQINPGPTPLTSASITKGVPPLPMDPNSAAGSTSAFPTAAGDSMRTASTLSVDAATTVPNVVQFPVDDSAESILTKVLREWALASRIVPIYPAKMQERLKSVTANREQVQLDIATREDTLCQPRHRTIDEIRSALSFIDQGYTLVAELSEFIQKIERAIEENERKTAESERIRPLVAERKRLAREREEALASLANITMELLKARQDEIATLTRKIAELDGQLGTTTSETSAKTKGKRAKSKKGFRLPDADDSDEGPSDEEDDRREMAKWNEMNSEERKKFTAKVRKSIDAYLASGDIKDFRATHRNALRTIQSLLPEESFSSKSVATAILTTSHSNTKCRYHTGSQKIKIFDGIGDILVQGVGYPGKYNKKGVTAIPRPGYMNCGCLIDDALLDFFFWKTLFITSTRPDRSSLSESMKGDKFQPRIRAFVIQLFKSSTFLTANDIFTSERPFGKAQRELHLYKLSMQRMNEWVTACTRVHTTSTTTIDLEESKEGNGSSIVV